ncbi:MAG: hypothetical protein OXK21_02390 [Chloroflexota bacterium]|nr:hypothetical protein [Chloroflexota bacterium]
MELGELIDQAVGESLAAMLNTNIVKPTATALLPAQYDAVEVGPLRVIGGVRPQNFDVGYRPDGVRIAFDSKTLNDADSVRKNYQNMINDLATEATTVHSRFPHAIVGFVVAIPQPCLNEPQQSALVGTLERLAGRTGPEDADHLAEAMSLVIWRPEDGSIANDLPNPMSLLRIENFSEQVEGAYLARYKGLPPHAE